LPENYPPQTRLLYQCNYAKSRRNPLPFGEMAMADHAELEYATAMGNDYPAHEQMYRNFIALVKAAVATVVVILLGMAFLDVI
jgi:hypothetical protein